MSEPLRESNAQQFFSWVIPHATLTATHRQGIKPSRQGRITAARYHNYTGLVAHASNNFKLQIMKGATVMATGFDTDADDGASLAADTAVALTLSATEANRVFAADDTIGPLYTEEGTATLPDGCLVIEGYFF